MPGTFFRSSRLLARILHEAAMKMPLNPRQSMATGENSKNTNCHLSARRLLASSFSAMTAFCRQIHAISMNMPAKCVSQKNSRARSSTLHAICGLGSAIFLSAALSGNTLACESEDTAAAYDKHYPEIKYPKLRKAMDAGEVFIIDANSTETYQKGHLPGAHSMANLKLRGGLPELEVYPIVVYCGGPQCPAWHSAADFATARGYSNVMHFKGGIKVWKEQGDTLSTGSGS